MKIKQQYKTNIKKIVIIIFSWVLSCQCPYPHHEWQPTFTSPGGPLKRLGMSLVPLWALWGLLRLWPGPTPVCTSPQNPQLLELDQFHLWELSIQIFHRCRVYQDDCRDLICGLCSCMGILLFLFLSCPAPRVQLWFYPHLCVWTTHRSLLLRLPWSTRVCPGEDRVQRWHDCLGWRGPGGHKCMGKPATGTIDPARVPSGQCEKVSPGVG